MQVVQVTDLHLFADPGAELKGVVTRDAVRRVLKEVHQRCPDCDYLILTGDLAHDEVQPTYVALREMLGDWVQRCRMVPGNHDNRAAMRAVFPEVVPAGEGSLWFDEPAGSWRLIGLDSHVPGEVPGRIAKEQLDWLAEQLQRQSDCPTALFVHHPAVEVGSPWIDNNILLQDPERFIDMVKSSPQVRLICIGHIHQEFTSRIGKAHLHATPAASVQFTPRTEQLIVDPIAPGFAILDLADDGEFKIEVVRVSA